jgi:hypothetical protein
MGRTGYGGNVGGGTYGPVERNSRMHQSKQQHGFVVVVEKVLVSDPRAATRDAASGHAGTSTLTKRRKRCRGIGGWGWGGENLGGFCDLRAQRGPGVDRVLCEDQSGDRDFAAKALLSLDQGCKPHAGAEISPPGRQQLLTTF